MDAGVLEMDLVRFLATPPLLFTQGPGPRGGSGSVDRPQESVVRGAVRRPYFTAHADEAGIPRSPDGPTRADSAERLLRQLYVQSEAAEATGNRSEALRLAEQILALLTRSGVQISSKNANYVGNTAVTAEQLEDHDLARKLYVAALNLDPAHSNNIQNYVDLFTHDPLFWQVLLNTILFATVYTVANLVVCILIARWLLSTGRFGTVVRVLMFIPVVTPMLANAMVW